MSRDARSGCLTSSRPRGQNAETVDSDGDATHQARSRSPTLLDSSTTRRLRPRASPVAEAFEELFDTAYTSRIECPPLVLPRAAERIDEHLRGPRTSHDRAQTHGPARLRKVDERQTGEVESSARGIKRIRRLVSEAMSKARFGHRQHVYAQPPRAQRELNVFQPELAIGGERTDAFESNLA